MGLFTLFKGKAQQTLYGASQRLLRTGKDDEDLFKAYIPNFLYKPPYGMPRKVNVIQLKKLSKNPYVFSIIKTLCDEATAVPWDIKVREDFEQDGVDYTEKIKEIRRFMTNPNGNEQSFQHILRQVLTDILEIDSGVIVKVFNRMGKLKHLFARDGGTFLKNPDIYGYLGNRAEFVPPMPDGFDVSVPVDVGGTPTQTQQQMLNHYNILMREQAGYYQYGWTAGSMPVPFGKREIIYFMQNPRGDSIYGRSAVEILTNVIYNLIYGVDFHLDFFTNNNMPEGVIQLLGAQTEHISQFRENFESQFREKDIFGNLRKRFYNFPITNTEVKFTPFSFTAKDMEILANQQWFTKVMWMCFGVNADEMGFTETSNRAVGDAQAQIFKRKAVKPLLNILEYHLNTQLLPEFFSEVGGELPDFRNVPLEFKFDVYDYDEDKKKHDLLEQEIRMGIKTPTMVAVELGINLDELKKSQEEDAAKKMEMFQQQQVMIPENPGKEKDDEESSEEEGLSPAMKKKEDSGITAKAKPVKDKELMKEIEGYIDDVGKGISEAISNTPANQVKV